VVGGRLTRPRAGRASLRRVSRRARGCRPPMASSSSRRRLDASSMPGARAGKRKAAPSADALPAVKVLADLDERRAKIDFETNSCQQKPCRNDSIGSDMGEYLHMACGLATCAVCCAFCDHIPHKDRVWSESGQNALCLFCSEALVRTVLSPKQGTSRPSSWANCAGVRVRPNTGSSAVALAFWHSLSLLRALPRGATSTALIAHHACVAPRVRTTQSRTLHTS